MSRYICNKDQDSLYSPFSAPIASTILEILADMDSKIIQDLLALHFLEEEEGQPVLCQEEVNLALRIKPSSIEGCSEASSTEVFFPDNLHEKTDRTVNPTAAERLVMARKAVEYRRSARIPNPDSHTANLLRRWQRKWKRKWDLADDKDEDALWERQKQRFESRMRLWGPLLSKKSRENFEHWKAKYGLDNGRHYNELQAQEWGDERIREMTKARKERAEFLCRRESRMAVSTPYGTYLQSSLTFLCRILKGSYGFP